MKKINRISIAVISCLLFVVAYILICCKVDAPRDMDDKISKSTISDIDPQKVMNITGIPFSIQKSKSFGLRALHKFYWISTSDRLREKDVTNLAETIIKEIILLKSESFHSFTIHFIWQEDLDETVEKSKCYARAYYLPDGEWEKVGRVPLDEYRDYKWQYSFF
jgi:hypothetical protein